MKYPRINHMPVPLKQSSNAICWVCGQKAKFKVEIEVNWFRGDDETVKACEEHKRTAVKA